MDNVQKCVLVKTFNTTRGGKLSQVKVYPLRDFVDGLVRGVNRNTQVAELGGYTSLPMCQIDLEGFENIFSEIDIAKMQVNGVLDYYPDGYCRWGESVYTEVADKYPIFSAKIYKKYGIKRLPTSEKEI